MTTPRISKLEARKRRYVNWELKKRASPPSLVTGRHRLVLTWSRDDSQPPGTVTHEFVLVGTHAGHLGRARPATAAEENHRRERKGHDDRG